jgi:hypothetical protein
MRDEFSHSWCFTVYLSVVCPDVFSFLMLKFAPLIYFVAVVLDLDCGKRGVVFLSHGEI